VLFSAIDAALRAAEQNAANREAGMTDLFGETVQASRSAADPYAELRHRAPWTDRERLQGERETLGLYVTGIRSMTARRSCGALRRSAWRTCARTAAATAASPA
jgi:DNA polymerase III alpha subunit